jgi:DNA helicase-2/ATP-dependent DNA helicase PcrA
MPPDGPPAARPDADVDRLGPPPPPDLTAAQAAAAAHRRGPLLIVAGAGSGKTRTLVHRVADLIRSGTPPERLLLLTFTRRAAQEMLGRTGALAGLAARRVQGGTFHGVANRLLRRYGPAAGLPADFTILDRADAADLMGLARAALGFAETAKPETAAQRPKGRFPRAETCLTVHSRHVDTGEPVADCLAERFPHFLDWAEDLERVFADYARRKADGNLLDYDDLLLALALLLEQGGPVADRIRREFDHVLVDEYQDTNPLQARILRALCPAGTLTVVGDDAQSIYAFRGATVRQHPRLSRSHFPGTTVVTLEQNFRSTAAHPRHEQRGHLAARASATARSSGPTAPPASRRGS